MISLSPTTPGQSRLLSLSGNCDVRSATELQLSLVELLREELPVTIDCSKVESIDTACTQLLLAAKRESTQPVTLVYGEDCEAAKWFELAGVNNYLSNESGPNKTLPDWLLPVTHSLAI